MRVLVCGGRNFEDYDFMGTWFWNELYSKIEGFNFEVIIHGGAPGADTLAGLWAERHGCPVIVYPADWKKYGKEAGPIRNKQMLEEGKPDLVIAFPGGKGTANMVKLAREANIEVKEIKDESNKS